MATYNELLAQYNGQAKATVATPLFTKAVDLVVMKPHAAVTVYVDTYALRVEQQKLEYLSRIMAKK